MPGLVCPIEIGGIVPTTYLSSVAIMLWLVYQCFKSMNWSKNKGLKYLGLALFCTQIAWCTLIAVENLIWAFALDCAVGTEFDAKIGIFVSSLFYAQYCVMIALLFHRLKTVFHGTAYKLSPCTVWTFSTIYVSSIVVGLIQSFIQDWSRASTFSILQFTLLLLMGLLTLSSISFLPFLFVKKLIDVNKRAQQSNENKLLSTITRQTILALISIASFLMLIAVYMIFTSTELFITSIHATFAWILLSLVDIWTNFICIFLSYQASNDYYAKICGCCDTKCKQLCSGMVKSQPIKKSELSTLESRSGDTSV